MKHDRWQRGASHRELMKYTVFVFTLFRLLRMLRCLSGLLSHPDESITLSGWGIKASHRTLPPQTHWEVLVPGSQRLVKSSLSKALKTRARTQTGALNFSSVTNCCQEQRTANAGKFYLLNVDTSLFRIAFQSKWDNGGLCRAHSTSKPRRATMWESSAGVGYRLEPGNVLTKLQGLGRQTRLKIWTSVQERVTGQVCIAYQICLEVNERYRSFMAGVNAAGGSQHFLSTVQLFQTPHRVPDVFTWMTFRLDVISDYWLCGGRIVTITLHSIKFSIFR